MIQPHMSRVMRADSSPYRAAPGCRHAVVVETTCNYQPPNWFDEAGRVHCGFAVRLRVFECADCGASVPNPLRALARAEVPRRPRCVAPFCDCDFKPQYNTSP